MARLFLLEYWGGGHGLPKLLSPRIKYNSDSTGSLPTLQFPNYRIRSLTYVSNKNHDYFGRLHRPAGMIARRPVWDELADLNRLLTNQAVDQQMPEIRGSMADVKNSEARSGGKGRILTIGF